jgi:hypothetical protein
MSTPCPDCRAPLTGAARCASCGLPLVGPLAARLWQVDQQLAALTTERISLLTRLRMPAPEVPPARAVEATPRSAQNTLLGLGALLLAAAVLVFAAVTYSHLGTGGRALVLVALTIAAAGAATTLARRGLEASAEAVGAVTLVLGVADAWAVRRAGLGSTLELGSYAALASGVLALLAATWAAVTPLRVTQAATVAFAQGLVVFELAQHHGTAARVGAVLALLTAVDAVVARLPLPAVVRWVAGASAAVGTLSVLIATFQSVVDADRAGCAGPAVLALAAAWLAWQAVPFAGFAVPVLAATAAFAASTVQRPLALAAVALVTLPICALLRKRTEPVLGAVAVAGLAVLLEAEGIGQAIVGPLSWLSPNAWSFHGTSARDALGLHWDGSLVTVVVAAAAALVVLAAGLLLDRPLELPAALLLGLAWVTLPLGLGADFRVALAMQLALPAALCWTRLAPAGLAVGALATSWSLAQQGTTLVALPVAAALVVRSRWLTGVAVALLGGELVAVGATQHLQVEQLGGALLLAVAAAVQLSFVLTTERRWSCEGAAAALGAVSVLLAAPDAGWLSWTLAVNGLLALTVAARKDRRLVGYAGALLLAGSSWVRLADAHVHAPEPYVLPLAAMTLVLGYLRRQAHPSMGSLEAYAGGLALGLLPSLLVSLDDASPFRALMVLLAGAVVVLVGGHQRLRAPLVIGGGVLAIEAVHLLAPYAAALPRWLVLAAAGAALVGVGATYEQRLRDVHRLRERFDSYA